MGASLDGSPVIARGHGDGVDAVHDALVVGRGTIRIELRESAGSDDSIDDVLSRQAARLEGIAWDPTRDANATLVAQVRKNPQSHAQFGDGAETARNRLGHTVHEVRSHGVPTIHGDVHDHDVVRQHANLDVPRSPAASDKSWHRLVRQSEDFVAALKNAPRHRIPISRTSQLHLRRHLRRIGFREKSSARAHYLGGIRGRRHNAGLLRDHRHDQIATVDAHVERNSVRQRIGSKHVLDELVGGLRVEATGIEGSLEVREIDPSRVPDERTPFPHGHLVKAR
jgi:hypothetical protein